MSKPIKKGEKLPPELEALTKKTHFGCDDIRVYYNRFIKICKREGTIDSEGFRKCMGIIGIVNKSALCDLIFNAFDVRNAQALTFEDYITSLSTMTSGTEEEKMQFSFRILDMDRCGSVNYDEWEIMMKSAGQIMAYMDSITGVNDERKPQKVNAELNSKISDEYIRKTFNMIDTNGDGKFDYNDYKVCMTKNPDMMNWMSGVSLDSHSDPGFSDTDADKSKVLAHLSEGLKVAMRDVSIVAHLLNDSLNLLESTPHRRGSVVDSLEQFSQGVAPASSLYLNKTDEYNNEVNKKEGENKPTTPRATTPREPPMSSSSRKHHHHSKSNHHHHRDKDDKKKDKSSKEEKPKEEEEKPKEEPKKEEKHHHHHHKDKDEKPKEEPKKEEKPKEEEDPPKKEETPKKEKHHHKDKKDPKPDDIKTNVSSSSDVKNPPAASPVSINMKKQEELNDLLKRAAKQQLTLINRIDKMQNTIQRVLFGEVPRGRSESVAETTQILNDEVKVDLANKVEDIMDDTAINSPKGDGIAEPRPTSMTGNKSTNGLAIPFGHENWNMVLDLMNGVRIAVSRTNAEMDRPLEIRDYTMKEKFSIVPPKMMEEQPVCRFVDYAPMVFKKLREHWGVSADEYLQSIGPKQLLEGLITGNLSSLSELGSEGKSGSFFYYTKDGNYMVKTVSHGEHLLFRRTLQDYYSHILTNKDTLLIHYMGAHQMRFSKHSKLGGKRMYFVVMGNLFNTPYDIHWKYDLKGSWVGRITKGEKNPNIALKDLDVEEPFHVGPSLKTTLINQLKADTDFLASHNIIDYSLLVGVHNREEPYTKSVKKVPGVPFYQRDSGGLLSSDKKHIYFFGVIDTLIKYDNYKRGELFFKSFAFDRHGISCQPPFTYAKRFMDYMEEHID